MKLVRAILAIFIIFTLFFLLVNHTANRLRIENVAYPVSTRMAAQQGTMEQTCPSNFYTILTIDGGGTRGLIPLMYLEYLERISQQATVSMFNLMGGISTGAIVISSLSRARNDHDHLLEYSAKQVARLYRENAPSFFKANAMYSFVSLKGLLLPLFNSENKNNYFKDKFKSIPLGDISNEIAIFSYDVIRKKVLLFCNWSGCDKKLQRYSMASIVSAATSIMGVFSPMTFFSEDNIVTHVGSDLSILSNNPAYITYKLATRICPDVKHYVVVSIGTGHYPEMGNTRDTYDWGLFKWIPNVLAAANEVSSGMVSEYLKDIVWLERSHLQDNQLPKLVYIRLNPPLRWSESSPIATSPEEFDYFEQAARNDIKSNALLLKCITKIREQDGLNKACTNEILKYVHQDNYLDFEEFLPIIFKR